MICPPPTIVGLWMLAAIVGRDCRPRLSAAIVGHDGWPRWSAAMVGRDGRPRSSDANLEFFGRMRKCLAPISRRFIKEPTNGIQGVKGHPKTLGNLIKMKLKTGEISRGTREIKKCHGGLGQVGARSEGRRKRGRCSFFFLLLLTGDDSHGISMKPISKSFPMDKGLRELNCTILSANHD